MKYKIIKRGEPGVIGGGVTKYYASPHYTGEIDLYELGKELSERTTVSRVDAEAVLSGFADLISDRLSEGKIVRLGNFGAFRISINSRGEEASQDVTSRSIKKGRVLFRPAVRFQKQLDRLNFERVKDVIGNPYDDETGATS